MLNYIIGFYLELRVIYVPITEDILKHIKLMADAAVKALKVHEHLPSCNICQNHNSSLSIGKRSE